MPVVPQPLSTSGQNPLVSPPSGSGVVPVPIQPTPGNPDIDLITSSYAIAMLGAAGTTLTTAQTSILPTLITAASREIARFCQRPLVLRSFDEIVSLEGTRQNQGEPSAAKLSYYPIPTVLSVMTSRVTGITITNTDATTNQYATVVFTRTGDPEYLGLVYTGVSLSRMASGTLGTDTLSFAGYPTLDALATAINGLGNGWTAVVSSPYGSWPSRDLVGVREPKNALQPGASLDLFTQPASGFDISPSTGIFQATSGWNGSGNSDWAFDGYGGYGYGSGYTGSRQYRVRYAAGWETIPEDLQQVTAEMVQGMYERIAIDNTIKTETAGDYSYTMRDAVENLSATAQSVLERYRDWKV